MAYIDIDDINNQTGVDVTKYADHIDALILAVEEGINNFCKRPDGFLADSVATAREYVGTGLGYQRINECVEITQVAVKDSITDANYTALDADDWVGFAGHIKRPNFQPLSLNEPRPYTGILTTVTGNRSFFTSGFSSNAYIPGFDVPLDRDFFDIGQPTVRVTAKWGYAVEVPEAIKQACIIQVSRFFKRSQAQWSDAIANGDFQELRFVKPSDPAYDFLVNYGGFRKVQIG